MNVLISAKNIPIKSPYPPPKGYCKFQREWAWGAWVLKANI